MLGGYSNVEGVDLRQRGKDPVVTPVDQLGVPTYDELVLVANREALEADPEKFRLFIAALQRGTDAAVQQPDAATKAVLEANDGPRPETDRSRGRSDAAAAGRARRRAQPYGYMDPDEWSTFAGWMRDNGLIESLPDAGRTAQQRLPARAKSPNSRVRLRASSRLTSVAGIAAWKRWPWA